MTTPLKFYELPAEEQAAITKAIMTGSPKIEMYAKGHNYWVTRDEGTGIDLEYCYRLQPKKLDIPWDIINNKFNYAVLDYDGSVWFGKDMFVTDDGHWLTQKECTKETAIAIDTTGVYYKTSQTKRPYA